MTIVLMLPWIPSRFAAHSLTASEYQQ